MRRNSEKFEDGLERTQVHGIARGIEQSNSSLNSQPKRLPKVTPGYRERASVSRSEALHIRFHNPGRIIEPKRELRLRSQNVPDPAHSASPNSSRRADMRGKIILCTLILHKMQP